LTGPTEAEHRANMVTAAGPPAPPPAAPAARVTGAPILDGLQEMLYGAGVYSRTEALAVPSIARGRDLLVGFLSTLPLRAWLPPAVSDPHGAPVPAPAPDWCERPDPARPRAWTVSGLVDDLLFYGRGYWLVVARADGWPSAFRWAPVEEVAVGLDGKARWTPGTRSGFLPFSLPPVELGPVDVVEFFSPLVPILETGARTLSTTSRLEAAANRFAATEIPAGWLRQTGGEPMTHDEMTAEAARFAATRATNTVAMLNEFVEWVESQMNPATLQLVEARAYQAIEAARLTNVPAALLDAEVSSMTYTNTRDSMSGLWWFGAYPVAEAIGQVLSGPNVTRPGLTIRFDPAGSLDAPSFTTPGPLDRPRPESPL
jgi:hypothetical protein